MAKYLKAITLIVLTSLLPIFSSKAQYYEGKTFIASMIIDGDTAIYSFEPSENPTFTKLSASESNIFANGGAVYYDNTLHVFRDKYDGTSVYTEYDMTDWSRKTNPEVLDFTFMGGPAYDRYTKRTYAQLWMNDWDKYPEGLYFGYIDLATKRIETISVYDYEVTALTHFMIDDQLYVFDVNAKIYKVDTYSGKSTLAVTTDINVKNDIPTGDLASSVYDPRTGMLYVVTRQAYNKKSIFFEIDVKTGKSKKVFTVSYPLTAVWLPGADAPVAKTFEAPYMSVFNRNGILTDWTVFDSNNDGNTWTLSGIDLIDNNAAVQADDWFVSPEIALEGGKTYEVGYKVEGAATTAVALHFGSGDTPDQLSNTVNPTLKGGRYVANITPASSGYYRFGFHDTTPVGADGKTAKATLRYLYVETEPDGEAPDSVTNLVITPGNVGALSATASYTSPNQTIEGSTLQSISKIEVSVNGEVCRTTERPRVGATIRIPVIGEYVNGPNNLIKIVAYNDAGAGRASIVEQFVGVDQPLPVLNLHMEESVSMGQMTLVWDKVPDVGVNGHYVNPNNMRYIIYDSNGDSINVVSEPRSPVWAYWNEDYSQRLESWSVRAYNMVGKSEPVTYYYPVGEFYFTPYTETFANGKSQSFFYVEDMNPDLKFEIADGIPYSADNDRGSLHVYTDSEVTLNSTLRMGKLANGGGVMSTLVYNYYRQPADVTMVVEKINYDGQVEVLATHNLGEEAKAVEAGEHNWRQSWGTDSLTMGSVSQQGVSHLRFRFITENEKIDTYIDNLRFDYSVETDLATYVELPDSIYKGFPITAIVHVRNEGRTDVDHFGLFVEWNYVTLEDSLHREVLRAGEEKTYYYTIHPDETNGATMFRVSAKVDLGGDDATFNNYSETNVPFNWDPVPYVEISSHRGGVNTPTILFWSAIPQGELSIPVLDAFDSYEPWATDLGRWTAIDNSGSDAVGGKIWKDYPQEGQPTSFTVITVNGKEAERMPYFKAHSGTKYAIAPHKVSATTGERLVGDEWLISPRLTGEEQTLSLYATSFNFNSILYPENYHDSFQVLISKTDNDEASFELLAEVDVNSVEWEPFSFNLPAGTLYFAIRHNPPTTAYDETERPNYMLGIDDVSYNRMTKAVGIELYRDNHLLGVLPPSSTGYSDIVNDEIKWHIYDIRVLYDDGHYSPFTEYYVWAGYNPLLGIEEVTTDDAPADVYDTKGVLVRAKATTLKGLPKGVYIVNGQKIAVK